MWSCNSPMSLSSSESSSGSTHAIASMPLATAPPKRAEGESRNCDECGLLMTPNGEGNSDCPTRLYSEDRLAVPPLAFGSHGKNAFGDPVRNDFDRVGTRSRKRRRCE